MTTSAPLVEALPVAKLTVDPGVQRSIDKARVDKIVNDFQFESIGTVVVSKRDDGTCHVIDGQHRVAAVQGAGYGDQSVTCLVYEGLTRSEEAAMFRRLNNTRQVMPVDKFRVRVVEGDEAAVTLNRILNEHGWKVEQSKSNGAFAAVAALEKVFRGKLAGPGDTAKICDTLISVVTEAWGHDSDGVRAEIIAGVGAVLLRYNTRVDLPKLIHELAQVKSGPRGLVGKAKGLRDFRGGTLSEALAEILVEMINRQRRTNRLPEWRSAA